MLKKHLLFNVGFIILFFAQLSTESHLLTELLLIENLHYFTKPLITISLLVLLVYHTGLRGRFSKRIASGLFFGLLGDVCLMFDAQSSLFFIYGLVFFLIGHLFYISAFYLDYKVNTTVYKNKTRFTAAVMGIFSIALCTALWSYLGDLKIPVAGYALVISMMVIMAINRFGRVNSLSFRIVFIGAVLFVVSDSALAVDRFIYSFPQSGLLIMATYMAAQYLITMGNLERKIKKKVVEEGV